MTFRLHNKLTGGKRHFVMPPLPAEFADKDGIVPMQYVLDPAIGSETVLLWLDHTDFVQQLAAVRPFTLMMKTVPYRSQHGPLACLLFYVPDPRNPGRPFAAAETYANLRSPTALQSWFDLARQSHWHLILAGAGDELLDLFEFENVYGLEVMLALAETGDGPPPAPGFDPEFEAAKQEFMAKFTIDEILTSPLYVTGW